METLFFFNFMYILFFGGFLSLCVNWSHLFLMVLSLEFLMLGLFYGVTVLVSVGILVSWFILVYLFIVVCEACLCLGILVSLVGGMSSAMVSMYGLMQC